MGIRIHPKEAQNYSDLSNVNYWIKIYDLYWPILLIQNSLLAQNCVEFIKIQHSFTDSSGNTHYIDKSLTKEQAYTELIAYNTKLTRDRVNKQIKKSQTKAETDAYYKKIVEKDS